MSELHNLLRYLYHPRPRYLGALDSPEPRPDDAAKRRQQAALACVWRGFRRRASLRAMRRCADVPPPLFAEARVRWSEQLEARGPVPVNALLDAQRHVHLAKFCSYVPLHYVTSPARLAALYALARLFPRRWRQLYAAAFGGECVDRRAAAAIDRLNGVCAEPSHLELIELVDLHCAYQRPASERERDAVFNAQRDFYVGSRALVAAALGTRSRKETFRATSLLLVARVALNVHAQRSLVAFIAKHKPCTRRQLRALEQLWVAAPRANERFVARVYGQFTMLGGRKQTPAVDATGGSA